LSVPWVRSNRKIAEEKEKRRSRVKQVAGGNNSISNFLTRLTQGRVRPEIKHVAEVSLFSAQNPSRRFFLLSHSPICFRRRQILRSFSLLPLLLNSIWCSIFLFLHFLFLQLLYRFTRLIYSSHRGCYCDQEEGRGCNAYRYRTRARGAWSRARGLSLSPSLPRSLDSIKCILCFLILFSALFLRILLIILDYLFFIRTHKPYG